MVFRFIWIDEAGMFVAVWQEMITLYDFGVNVILYLVHCIILFLLSSVHFFWFIWVGMIVAVWQEVITLYYYDMIIILYLVHWLILYCLDLHAVTYQLKEYSKYVIGWLSRSDYSVWLWHDFYLISRLLFNSLPV